MPARTSAPGSRSPFHPAHAVASARMFETHDPALVTPVLCPCGTTRQGPPRDLPTAEFASSIALENSPAGAALPAWPSVVPLSRILVLLRGPGSRFSSQRKLSGLPADVGRKGASRS